MNDAMFRQIFRVKQPMTEDTFVACVKAILNLNAAVRMITGGSEQLCFRLPDADMKSAIKVLNTLGMPIPDIAWTLQVHIEEVKATI